MLRSSSALLHPPHLPRFSFLRPHPSATLLPLSSFFVIVILPSPFIINPPPSALHNPSSRILNPPPYFILPLPPSSFLRPPALFRALLFLLLPHRSTFPPLSSLLHLPTSSNKNVILPPPSSFTRLPSSAPFHLFPHHLSPPTPTSSLTHPSEFLLINPPSCNLPHHSSHCHSFLIPPSPSLTPSSLLLPITIPHPHSPFLTRPSSYIFSYPSS